jgi:regulatory protein
MTDDKRHISATPAKISRQQAMNTAVRILTHRDHSRYELKQKLQQRGFGSSVIDTVIAECERLNYINDPRTAHLYILQLKNKRYGKRYIRMALKKKRLNSKAIENTLLQNYSEADERENASKLLEKKREAFERQTDPQKKSDKIYRFLYSRGYSKDVITALIRDLK